MKSSKTIAKMAIVSFAALAPLSPALAQPVQSGLYAFHTSQIAGCPNLDWHIVAKKNGALGGFVAWGNPEQMARLNGSFNKNSRKFTIHAKEVGGQERTATIQGEATGEYVTMRIEGSGTPCDNKPLNVPRVAGGLQGGGG